MKKILGIFLSITVVGLTACSDTVTQPNPMTGLVVPAPPLADANPVVQKITGSGHYTSPPVSLAPGRRRVFTMHAQKMADGTVKGSYTLVLHVPGEAPEKARGTITCFTVIDNVAWVGGHQDGDDPPDIVWQVVDNGQGKQAEPDEIGLSFGPFNFPTLFEAGFAQDFCDQHPDELDFGPPYGLFPMSGLRTPVEAGNITIEVR